MPIYKLGSFAKGKTSLKLDNSGVHAAKKNMF